MITRRQTSIVSATAVACLFIIAIPRAQAAEDDAAMQATCGTGAAPSVGVLTTTPEVGVIHVSVLVNPLGCPATQAFEYGFTTSYGQSQELGFQLTVPSGIHSSIYGLQCNTLYHVRATATNANGTGTSPDVAVSTKPCPPTPIVTTELVTGVSSRGASFHGTAVTWGTNWAYGYFEYGTTTAYGNRTLMVWVHDLIDNFPARIGGPGAGRVGDESIVTGLVCGTVYHYRAVLVHPGGTTAGEDATFLTGDAPCGPTPGDLEADDRSELTVWRPDGGVWYSLASTVGYVYDSYYATAWGSETAGDVALFGEVDGDGKADLMVWRAGTGTWYWLTSSTGYDYTTAGAKQWGNQSLGDVPLTGDIDGDGKTELIVWRASTGTWYWLRSQLEDFRPAFHRERYDYAAAGEAQWGNQSLGDVPFTGDVDGDGKSDLIVWRASTGTWFWLTSSSGFDPAASGIRQWGNQGLGDVPMVGDIDGDGKADLIVWRASTGTWFWLTSSTGYDPASHGLRQWGNDGLGDVPLIKDMDGDGKSDLTVWRSSTGVWYWLTSASGYDYAASDLRQWGAPGDIPVTTRPFRR